jgi:quercetin dioxygenase-like cupin family protein
MDMPFIRTSALPPREPLPGWVGRCFRSDHMTFVYDEIAPGARVHPHRHENGEVWNVLDGDLEMVVGGVAQVLGAGEAVVPADVEHSAAAVRRCRVIVDNHPARATVAGIDIR